MKGPDKFLIGIVAAVALLVVVTFTVAFLRPEPTYQSDDTPEGVAHNYLLALQQEDYERAYGYLSPTIEGYPATPEAFAADIRRDSWGFDLNETSITLVVESANITGDSARASVRRTRFYQGRLFQSSQRSTKFDITLGRDESDGTWKIVEADSYWNRCWHDQERCR